MGFMVTRSMIVPHLFAAGALHIVQIRRGEVAHLVASQGRRLAHSLSMCVLQEGQFVVAECAGSGRLRDDADEWRDAAVSGVLVLGEARGLEMGKVTESLATW